MNDNSVTDKFNNLVFNCSYDIIVLYSKLQILCKQIKEKLNLYTNYEENIQKTIYKVLNIPEKPTNTYIFEYIKNGDVINKTVSLKKNFVFLIIMLFFPFRTLIFFKFYCSLLFCAC
jgi:hypothetical protein